MKSHGYENILKPLLQDHVTLESRGLFIAHLGEFVKGTIQCVIADNLAAHGISGYIESFSGRYICRFCDAKKLIFNKRKLAQECLLFETKSCMTFM